MNADNEIRVLYIITKLELGGAQKVCLELAKQINKTNNFAFIVSGKEGTLVNEAKSIKRVLLLDSFKREISIKNIINEIKNFLIIIKIIRKFKKRFPELIVHTHSTKAGIIGRWAAYFARTKTIVHTIHGFGFNDYQTKLRWYSIFFLEYITSLITKHFICVSEKDQNMGCVLFPNFKKKSSIIRAAVQYNDFYIPAKKISLNNQRYPFIIGTISCLKEQKNLFDILKAFKLAKDQISEKYKTTILLEIVGDGILRNNIQYWINDNNLKNNIILHGWQNNVATFLQKWSIFALSSLWEGLPCSVIEARLSLLPVVAYDVGGINEIIKDNKNGFLIKPKDWKSLAEKFILLATNKTTQKRLSFYQNNLNEFKNEFMVKKHLNLYNTLNKKNNKIIIKPLCIQKNT